MKMPPPDHIHDLTSFSAARQMKGWQAGKANQPDIAPTKQKDHPERWSSDLATRDYCCGFGGVVVADAGLAGAVAAVDAGLVVVGVVPVGRGVVEAEDAGFAGAGTPEVTL